MAFTINQTNSRHYRHRGFSRPLGLTRNHANFIARKPTNINSQLELKKKKSSYTTHMVTDSEFAIRWIIQQISTQNLLFLLSIRRVTQFRIVSYDETNGKNFNLCRWLKTIFGIEYAQYVANFPLLFYLGNFSSLTPELKIFAEFVLYLLFFITTLSSLVR